jgi:hypothetical protein
MNEPKITATTVLLFENLKECFDRLHPIIQGRVELIEKGPCGVEFTMRKDFKEHTEVYVPEGIDSVRFMGKYVKVVTKVGIFISEVQGSFSIECFTMPKK